MLTKKYMKIIINYYLDETNEEHEVLNINSFVNETGIPKVELISFLREDGWKEAQMGLWKRN